MSAQYQKVAGSAETVDSAQDVFAPRPTHTSVVDGKWVEVSPTIITPTGDIQLDVAESSLRALDLDDSYLETHIRVLKADGTALQADPANVVVTPSDAFAHSVFKRVDMYINEQLVESETNYATRSYTEIMAGVGKGAKRSKFISRSGWYEDKNLAKDSAGFDAATTVARAADLQASPLMCFCSKLHLNMFNQGRYLLPRNSMKLWLERASPKFSLSAANDNPTDGAIIHIVKCSLWLRTAVLNPSITEAIDNNLLADNPALYPIDRVSTKFYTMNAGTFAEERVLQRSGQLPTKMLVALVAQDAQSGSWTRNWARFQHFNVTSVELIADGETVERYNPNFGNNQFAREYHQAMAINHRDRDDSETITPREYADGRVFFAFDLTKDRQEGAHLISTGALSLKLVFSEELPVTVSLFVYSVRDDTVMIDVARRVNRTGDKVGS